MIRARCEVLSSRSAGAFQTLTLVAPQIAETAKPGQFVEVGMPEGRSFTLRRPFFIHQASRRGGWAGTIELVVERAGSGTAWLTELKAHEFVDLLGPLGNGFGYPRPTNCLLLAQGYGAAPLYFLAEELRGRGKRVDMIVAAPSQDRLFNPIEGKRIAHSITVVTEDGTAGERADPLEAFDEVVRRTSTQVVYAAGSRDVVRRVAQYCRANRLPSQVALEELMACGLGLCYTCVIPAVRADGSGYDMVRTCVDGPVFTASRVLWERWRADGENETASAPADAAALESPAPPGRFPGARRWPA